MLLLLPGAFSPGGGLEMYDRLVIMGAAAWCKAHGGRCEVVVLNDHADDVDTRYLAATGSQTQSFSHERSRFALEAVKRSLQLAPHVTVFGHVNFAPLAAALAVLRPHSRQWFLTYGIEVWRRVGRVQREMLRRANRIVTISDYTKQRLIEENALPGDNVALLPCALDPFWAEDYGPHPGTPPAGASSPVLLTVARLAASERYKGVEQTIRALVTVATRVPDVRYVVVGDGDDRPRLEGVARSLGLEQRVEFRGRVPFDALARAYSECSLFVMPSLKEGFGIVFLEAALFGKASVGGNHGGTPEVVQDGVTGRLVRYEDVEVLARVLVELLTDRRTLARMGAAAQARLRAHFTYSTFARNLAALLDAR